MATRQTQTKLQRWTDLIAALLTRQYPASFDELAREVPAYASGLDPAQREARKEGREGVSGQMARSCATFD